MCKRQIAASTKLLLQQALANTRYIAHSVLQGIEHDNTSKLSRRQMAHSLRLPVWLGHGSSSAALLIDLLLIDLKLLIGNIRRLFCLAVRGCGW